MRGSRAPSREKIRELADQERFNEIVSILDSESRVRELELWQLVAKSRFIQLSEQGPLPLEAASESLEEALRRDPEHVPAMLDMAAYLDTYDDDAAAAIDLFKKAADLVLDHLLDTIRGWAEAKLLDDEIRKEMLRSYNLFLKSLASAGLEAGIPARKVGWVDESEDL